MTPALIALIALVAVVAASLVAALVWLNHDQRSHAGFSSGFGPSAHGPPRFALNQRVSLELSPIDDERRREFRDAWLAIEQRFLHSPGQSLWEAHALALQVLRARGYPISEVPSSRDAALREVLELNERGLASLDQLRAAMLRYRKLLEPVIGL